MTTASTTPASFAPRAARTLSAKSWLTEAPLRMLMNNLDPEVAERPGELVVYGGIGRAARDWEAFDRIVADAAAARGRRDAARPVGQAGRRVPHPCRRAARADRQFQPRAALGDLGAFPRARSQGPDDVRPDDGRLVDLHRQPGHRAGHLRDLRRGRPAALRRRPRRALDPDRGPRRHGRRAAARRDDGGRLVPGRRVPAEPHRDAAAHRLSRPQADDLDEALAMHRAAMPRPASRSRSGCSATPPTSFPSSCAAACGPTSSPTRPRRTIRSTAICRRAGRSPNGIERRERDPKAVERAAARVDGRARARDARLPRARRADLRLRQQHPPDGEGGGRRRRLRLSRLRAGLHPAAVLPRRSGRSAGWRCRAIPRTSIAPTPR